MKNKLVSIIIPVYNVERYLDDCLESIVSQTYRDLEIILIDDGSTDSSGVLCDKWLKADKRIQVFHKKNGGVSSARNLGLKNINGTFLLFIDPDDHVSEYYVEKLVNSIELYDMASCGYYEEFKNNIIEHRIVDSSKEIDNNEANNMIFRFDGYKGFLWNKIFKTEIIINNNIVFDTKIHMCEDQLFVIEYLNFCKRIFLINDCLYFYRVRKSSMVFGSNKEKLLTIFDAYIRIKNLYEKENVTYLEFIYMTVWDYYYHKKNVDYKYYNLLNIKQSKKLLFISGGITFKQKIKLFIRIYLPFIYNIRNKYRNFNSEAFE